MLYDRMQRVRSAARFVFRNHPDIAREANAPAASARITPRSTNLRRGR
jgi:hypothetical protein